MWAKSALTATYLLAVGGMLVAQLEGMFGDSQNESPKRLQSFKV